MAPANGSKPLFAQLGKALESEGETLVSKVKVCESFVKGNVCTLGDFGWVLHRLSIAAH